MFARTARLLLRPGWAEDAPALAAAIADEAIVRNLATAPWPYGLREAEAFLASPKDPALPTFLLFARTSAAPELVGACGLGRRPSRNATRPSQSAKRVWSLPRPTLVPGYQRVPR
jgi:RimJ/RimL family protein N-acetyltransferase